jgi:hypothetical protein
MSPTHGIAVDPFPVPRGKPTAVEAQHYIYEEKRKRLGGGGLIANWRDVARDGLVYAQPPYGRAKLGTCMEKIVSEGTDNKVWTLALVPASTDVAWFHRCWQSAAQVCFWKGRIRFIDDRKQKNSALFPNVVFHFPGRIQVASRMKRFHRLFAEKGIVVPCRELAVADARIFRVAA